MLLSIANSRPRNMESIGVEGLYPPALRESASSLIGFIEQYYNYLNSIGLPSNEIANITRDKDIDIVSNKYLTEIQSLIARNIPNSRAVDKVTLYRIIIQYYRTRGSEDSIHTFFKIFFDEIVDIFYPRNYLFDLSGGRGSWSRLNLSSLRETVTNPNKVTIEVTSDYKIGPFSIFDLAPYKVTLKAISKYVWTYDGGQKSFDFPYIERVNISGVGQPEVFRWVYKYRDIVELYSTNDTPWPDEAQWQIFSRNIETAFAPEGAVDLESGLLSLMENGVINLEENATGGSALIIKNIQYDTAEIIPILPTIEKENITDEYTEVLTATTFWQFSDIASTISGFKITTQSSITTQISWGDSTDIIIAASDVPVSHTYVLPIIPSIWFGNTIDSFALIESESMSLLENGSNILLETLSQLENPNDVGKNFIDESQLPKEIISEKIIVIGDADVDVSLYGLTTEAAEFLIVERGLEPERNALAVESGVREERFIAIVDSKNVEYYHIFNVEVFPQYTTKIGDFVHSLEDVQAGEYNGDFRLSKVYRSIDLDPISWVEIDKNVDVWTYEDNKSFASDLYKLHDGEYWQKYSYRIRCGLPQEDWINDYLRFVHPSGLKLFSAILYEFVSRTAWNNAIDYRAKKPQDSYLWLNTYDPPVVGYHTPRYQPGWLTGNERLLTIILEYLKSSGSEDDFIRMIRIIVKLFSQNANPRNKTIRTEYQGWLKYLDPNELIAGYADKTFDEANSPWVDSSRNLFSNISSFISFKYKDTSYYPWFYSQLIPLDPVYEDTDPSYNEATISSFDIEMTPYNNSTLEDREPLTYRNALEQQNGDDFITENNSKQFITEGQVHARTVTSFTSNKSVVKENEIVRFYALTKYIPEGTTLYWNVSEPNIYPQSGTCVVKNEVAVFRAVPLVNFTDGASQTFTATIRQGGPNGAILANSEPVTVNNNLDLPTYLISANTNSTIEGGGVTFNITTTGVDDYEGLYYVASLPNDVAPAMGGLVVKNNAASFTLMASLDDLNSEGSEYFDVKIYACDSAGLSVATSESIEIKDAYRVWEFISKPAQLSDFSVSTSPASQIQIGWNDGSLAQTLDSADLVSHTYS